MVARLDPDLEVCEELAGFTVLSRDVTDLGGTWIERCAIGHDTWLVFEATDRGRWRRWYAVKRGRRSGYVATPTEAAAWVRAS